MGDHWDYDPAVTDETRGYCRRRSPPHNQDIEEIRLLVAIIAQAQQKTAILEDDNLTKDQQQEIDAVRRYASVWPTTTEIDWCGEYEPKRA
jgi:hypothetical protein